jgi:hypothetical protein
MLRKTSEPTVASQATISPALSPVKIAGRAAGNPTKRK